ncbi:MAG: tetratricopeptide repeat protein, partial [Candidatus Binatia bacterium]
LGVPTFYDKMLCVPALNLTVRWLDRASRALAARFRVAELVSSWEPRRLNAASMAVWVSLFVTMIGTGFLGRDHPGRDSGFWRRACEEGRHGGCRTWAKLLDLACQRKEADACETLGRMVDEGRLVERNPLQAGKSLFRACDLGLADGCMRLGKFMLADGRDAFLDACYRGEGESCFLLGELHHYGVGIVSDDGAALDLFRRSCASEWPRGCGRLGESYLTGQGTPVDPARAIESFEKACRGGHPGGCSAAATLYRDGATGPKNEELADRRLRQACELGLSSACPPGETPGGSSPLLDPATELLKLGG